jgi:hypothetical protein
VTPLSRVNDGVLVIYHYYEKDQSYIDNFLHFIQFAYRPELDFLIVIAGSCSIELPRASNIIYFEAENKNFDYGGYSQAMKALKFEKNYANFIFVNSSVRGPFLSPQHQKSWVEILLDLYADGVGIVGTAISLTPSHHAISAIYHQKYGYAERNKNILAHVQSTCYVLSQEALRFLIDDGFYDVHESLSKDETVRDYEMRLSQILLDRDLNLKCMLPEYNKPDYRSLTHEINPSAREGDSGFQHSYFGRTVHPYEAMFIKTSRNTSSDAYLSQLAYSMSLQFPINADVSCSAAIEDYRQRCKEIALSTSSFVVKKKSFWNLFS